MTATAPSPSIGEDSPSPPTVRSYSPLTAWSLRLTFGTTLLLIAVGSLVTTLKAGMAVPDWPTSFGYGMFEYPVAQWLFGPRNILVEHGHRLLGSVVGMLMIVALVALWRADARPWVRWLAIAALLGVIAQGVLGGLRVVLNRQALAALHGSFAPAFLALVAALVTVTSRTWLTSVAETAGHGRTAARIAATAWLLVGLVYAQIVLGAVLRHFPSRPAALTHVPLAFVVAALAIGLALRCDRARVPFRLPLIFASLSALQVGLGLAVWAAKYGWETYTVVAYGNHQVFSLLGHVVLGDLLLGVAVAQACWASRPPVAVRPAPPAAKVAPVRQSSACEAGLAAV